MKKFYSGWRTMARCASAVITVVALIALSVAPAKAATYKSVPLDTGGWFSGFAIHSSGRLYGFGDVFGAWRSDDAGNSWTYLNRDFTVDDNFVSGMAVAKNNADVVFFRTSSRLWKSTDGGATWNAVLSDLDNIELVRSCTPLIFHPSSDSEMWLAGERKNLAGRLWRSLDGGTNWTKVGGGTFDAVNVNGVYVRPEFPNQIWVSTKSGLYVSPDRGTSWTLAWSGGATKGVVRRADGIGYMAADGGGYRITASDWSNPATFNVVKTLGWYDGWGPTNAVVLADGSFVSGGDGDRYDLDTTNLKDAQRISSDGGQTWQYLPLNLAPSSPQPAWSAPIVAGDKADGGRDGIVQDPTNPARWFMTGGKAPSVTNDWGQNWKYFPVSSGIAGVMTYKVNFARTNSNVALVPGSDLGTFIINDGGASGAVSGSSYRTQPVQQTVHEVMSSDDGQTLVGAGVDQVLNKSLIARSTDGGATWTKLDLSNSGLIENYDGITRAVATPGNINDFLVVLSRRDDKSPNNPGMWRTTNGGATFSQVNGIPSTIDPGMRYHPENAYLEADGVHSSTRYFTTRPAAFYRSTDNGANWSQLATPFGTDYIHGMAVDKTTAGKVWVAGGGRGVKYSNNGGETWNDLVGFSNAYRIDAAQGRLAVWGTRSGDTWNKLYYSGDNGANWIEATGPNHRYAFTRDVAVDPWVAGKVWVSGISINVISGLGGSAPTPTPSSTPTPTPVATPTPTPSSTPTPTPTIALIDRTLESGGVITARGENAPNESKARAFDNNTSSKWLDFFSTSWIQYQFAGNASRVITRLSLTSGNDSPGRDPKNWTLQGSDDGSNFVTLDTRSNQVFTARKQTKTYNFSNTTAYKMIRLNITANTDGGNVIQLSEMRLWGPNVAAPTNLVVNSSFDAENFDTQTPAGWGEWESDALGNTVATTSSFSESSGGLQGGARHGTHYKDAPYRVYTYQTFSGLSNGLYTLRSHARRTGNQTVCYMEAKDFGSSAKSVNVPLSNSYQMIEVRDINVSNGTCTIGFWTVGEAQDYSHFDDVSFVKQ